MQTEGKPGRQGKDNSVNTDKKTRYQLTGGEVSNIKGGVSKLFFMTGFFFRRISMITMQMVNMLSQWNIVKSLSEEVVVTMINIARGTTDPGYWLFNLSYLSS